VKNLNKNIISNFHNLSKPVKSILILSLIVVSLASIELFTQIVVANHTTLSTSLVSGTNTISFRDITLGNSSSTVEATRIGNTLQITVNDPMANVNQLGADSITSSATSTTSGTAAASTILEEQNPGVFKGSITLSSSTTTSGSTLQAASDDDISVFYKPNPHQSFTTSQFLVQSDSLGLSKMSIELTGVSGSGTLDMSDVTILSAADIPCPSIAVLNPVQVDLTGATVSGVTVTVSYSNAFLGSNDPLFPFFLKVLYRPGTSGSFTSLTPVDPSNTFSGLDISGHVLADKTVASITQPSSVSGQYTLGFDDTGCSGGGGGGLVRPGLVVNALAGFASGGGGGGLPGPTISLGAVALSDAGSEIISMPQEIRDIANNHDPHTPLNSIIENYEDFDLPLSINGNGFVLGGYENTLETLTLEPGEPVEFKLVFYTTSEIAHTSLNFNLGPTRSIAGSDTQVLLYKDKFEIIDPNGNIASATGSLNNEGNLKRVATFSITFSDTVEWPTSDFVIRTWTDRLNSGDIIVYDAISVTSSEIVEIADEDVPVPEIQSLKSQYVPIWIKNNAAWWSQELIEDSDFVAGIEYLIQNEIITIHDNEIIAASYSSNEIPEWIKNNAGWWSEDLITEKEFIDGLQWLINNGIIEVTQT